MKRDIIRAIDFLMMTWVGAMSSTVGIIAEDKVLFTVGLIILIMNLKLNWRS